METAATRSVPVLLAPDLVETDQQIAISGVQALHGLRARRIRQGDALVVINGNGLLADGTANEVDLRHNLLGVDIESITRVEQTTPSLILAAALPKGERLTTMLDMATQLGISRFIPLDCEFGVVRYQPKMKERWQRVLESATKQSRRAWIPTVDDPMNVEQVVANANRSDLLMFGDHRAGLSTDSKSGKACSRIFVLVGPEGGFSGREQALLRGCPVSLASAIGNHVLRVETAAVALITEANLMRRERNAE